MPARIQLVLCTSILAAMLGACSEAPSRENISREAQPPPAVAPVARGDLNIVTGQRLYVPAYSEVYSAGDQGTWLMTVTLSIRNTNLDKSIVIESVQYFDTHGELVTEYVASPLLLAPMATTEYVVARQDVRGGTGANFIVAWGAEEPVYEPVVEAVMISAAGTQGLSLLSPARVLEVKD